MRVIERHLLNVAKLMPLFCTVAYNIYNIQCTLVSHSFDTQHLGLPRKQKACLVQYLLVGVGFICMLYMCVTTGDGLCPYLEYHLCHAAYQQVGTNYTL